MGENEHANIERLEQEIESLRAQLADVERVLERLAKLLEGDDGPGVWETLDGLTLITENLARLFESIHRESQLRGEVIEVLIPKLKMEQVWFQVAQMWQTFVIAQFAAE